MWKVYTRTGDAGFTSNANNERIPKDSTLINLQGSLDEINAQVGFLRSTIKDNTLFKDINADLKKIQHSLFILGSEVSYNLEKIYIKEEHILFLEKKIDYMISASPSLNSFVYPSGSTESTISQIIRTIVRRSERDFVKLLNDLKKDTYPFSYLFINRLSDYFFSLSLYINFNLGIKEEPLEF